MAKKQTFESKLSKSAGVTFKIVKVVYPYMSSKTNNYRYVELNMKVPLDANEDQFIANEIKNGIARMESRG